MAKAASGHLQSQKRYHHNDHIHDALYYITVCISALICCMMQQGNLFGQ